MFRNSCLNVILAVSMYMLGAGVSLAQANMKDFAKQASAELRLLKSFGEMERVVSQMDHFLSYGIVASTGGWGVAEFVNTTDYKNSYVIRNTAGDAQVVAARANAAIQRISYATEEQKNRALLIRESLEEIILATPKIADALFAEDFVSAREIYRDECQKPYEEAIRQVQAATLEFQKQLGGTILKMRMAE